MQISSVFLLLSQDIYYTSKFKEGLLVAYFCILTLEFFTTVRHKIQSDLRSNTDSM